MQYKKAKLSKAKSGWFVWFEFKNPHTGKFEKHIRKGGINRIQSVSDRKHHFQALALAINEWLANGGSPYDVTTKEAGLAGKPLYDCLDYLLNLKKSLTKNSYDHYRTTVKVFKEFLESKQMRYHLPQTFRPSDAVMFGDYMIAVKGYGGKSFNGNRSNLITFFNEMYSRLNIHGENPIKKIRKQRETQAIHKPFTKEQRTELKGWFVNNLPQLEKLERLLQLKTMLLEVQREKIKIYESTIIKIQTTKIPINLNPN